MKLSLAEFLANVKRIAARHHKNRITTADRYLATLAKCSGGLCPTDRARYQGPEFAKRLKEAAQLPTYKNDRMNFVSFSKDAADTTVEGRAAKFLSTFEGVYTSTKEDRDADILEAAGCSVDEKMPLLWQHDSTSPIGAHLGVVAQDKNKVLGKCGIADTVLGRDAAYLAELDCLRLSQGFRPTEFEPITQKDGGHEVVTGFHVLKYEMMEISLVSVPSNTDAILTAFHRNKLASPQVKSQAKTLDEHRQRFFTTGFGVKAFKPKKTVVGIKRANATGKVAKLVSRKEAADFEKALAEACGGITHSGDYGLCFYKAGDTADTYAVWWTAGDADTPDNSNEEGTPYTSADDIKTLLGGVAGVASVEIGSEANPPYDEGWREVYPEVRDWTSADADKPQPADDGAAPAQSSEPTDDTGKGKKPSKLKDGTPVAGSAEHVSLTVAPLVGPYLTQNGVAVDEGAEVAVQATYPDSVIVRVGKEGDPAAVYYRVGYTADDAGNVNLNGAPEQVELQTVIADAPKTDPATPNAGDSGDPSNGQIDGGNDPANAASHKPGTKTVKKWVAVKVKGKLGKKDTNSLKEAQEHLEDALTRDGMPTVCKTLVRRGADLIGEVMKADGTGDQNDPNDGKPAGNGEPPAMLSEGERQLWRLAMKATSKTAMSAMLTELAMRLEASDVSKLLDTLK